MSTAVILDRERAIDAWVAGYLRLRVPMDGATSGAYAGLSYAHFPLPVRPVQAEFFVRAADPARDAARARASGLGAHWLTVFEGDGGGSEPAYRALGYSLDAVEYLMARPIAGDEPAVRDERLQPITQADVLSAVNSAYGATAFVPAHLADPSISMMGIVEQGQPVAWGANVWAQPETAYVSRIFTRPEQRRRGLSTLIMGALLHEAAQRGARHSVLSATAMARPLYGRLGYRELATMQIWRSPIEPIE